MKKIYALSLILLSFAMPTFANTLWPPSHLFIGAYEGYSHVNNMLHNDGQFATGRLVFGMDVYSYQAATFDLELGLQNGKTMRHAPANNDPDFDVDSPIQTTLNPVLDLLVGMRLPAPWECRLYGMVKAGIAYRQLQFLEADYVSSINQVSGELQAGVGYQLTNQARVVLYYQGIYANGNVSYTQNNESLVSVSNIPTQQAGFLGFEFSF